MKRAAALATGKDLAEERRGIEAMLEALIGDNAADGELLLVVDMIRGAEAAAAVKAHVGSAARAEVAPVIDRARRGFARR